MSIHSSKYYHLIKTLRVQKKQQSEVSKLFKERQQKRLKQGHQLQIYTTRDIQQKINYDNIKECNERDRKITVKLSNIEEPQPQYPKLWIHFQNQSMIKYIKDESVSIQKTSFQNKDEKLIDFLLGQAEQEKKRKIEQVQNLSSKIKKKQQEITQMKQKGIDLSLQLQVFTKELNSLKQAFDKEQKVINQRSSKFKQERSKDLMIKNINKQDMQMRRVMESKIKLNQELDLGFQIQRRRAFNQAKQTINDKKKTVQNQYHQINIVLKQHQQLQNSYIQEKNKIEREKEVICRQIIYFVKSLLKHFKNHSRGIQWLINILHKQNVQIKQDDLPNELKKQDAAFLESILSKAKKTKSQQSKYYASATNFTPRSNTKQKTNYHFNTQPNAIYDEPHLNQHDQMVLKQHSKTAVYFDIQSNASVLNLNSEADQQLFKINSKSLKKVYQNTGEIISNLIKNKKWNYDSCKNIPNVQVQKEQQVILDKNIIEQKIRQRFVNIRQKGRRNFMRKLLFGENRQK